eukprot:Blabericola_migrator_1__396@NODE_109_length_14038_cov_78_087968_g97_i0_p2_GENE_NODE_109_length_14038_cov_78_087968_g97_i0NODE_109_length_14038_cov_78_087968_g97_i0_p2_ORF_typecomplete_len481_score61_09_NODE_109_length_14038_cov_78_087968_g97_i015262968
MPFVYVGPILHITSYLTIHQTRYLILALHATKDDGLLKVLWKSIANRFDSSPSLPLGPDPDATSDISHRKVVEDYSLQELRWAVLHSERCHHCEGELTLVSLGKEAPSADDPREGEVLGDEVQDANPPDVNQNDVGDAQPEGQVEDEVQAGAGVEMPAADTLPIVVEEDSDNDLKETQAKQVKYRLCADCWKKRVSIMTEEISIELKDYRIMCNIIWTDRRLFSAKMIASRLRRFMDCLHTASVYVYMEPVCRLRALLDEINPTISDHERAVFHLRVRERLGAAFEQGFYQDLVRVAGEHSQEDDDPETVEEAEPEVAINSAMQAELLKGRKRRRPPRRMLVTPKQVRRLKEENLARLICIELGPLIQAWKECNKFIETWQLSDTLMRRLTDIYCLLSNKYIMLIISSVGALIKREVWTRMGKHMADEELLAMLTCIKAVVCRIGTAGHKVRLERLVSEELNNSKVSVCTHLVRRHTSSF